MRKSPGRCDRHHTNIDAGQDRRIEPDFEAALAACAEHRDLERKPAQWHRRVGCRRDVQRSDRGGRGRRGGAAAGSRRSLERPDPMGRLAPVRIGGRRMLTGRYGGCRCRCEELAEVSALIRQWCHCRLPACRRQGCVARRVGSRLGRYRRCGRIRWAGADSGRPMPRLPPVPPPSLEERRFRRDWRRRGHTAAANATPVAAVASVVAATSGCVTCGFANAAVTYHRLNVRLCARGRIRSGRGDERGGRRCGDIGRSLRRRCTPVCLR